MSPTLTELIAAEDARAFLKVALALRYGEGAKINLSDFSRRAGFASRSYVSELLAGKKGFSLDAITRIRSALKLPRAYLELFEQLVLRDHPQLRLRRQTGDTIGKKLQELREALLETHSAPPQAAARKRRIAGGIGKPELLQVYAATGTVERGATLAEIRRRTGLSTPTTETALRRLAELEAVEARLDRYHPTRSTIDLFGLGSQPALQSLIEEAASGLRAKAASAITEPENLVFFSALSLDSARLPELREALRDAIFDVLNRFQNDEGDRVQSILFGSYR